ncbi:Protein EXORDIUM-like 4 [Hibiscus syriacus]|uniref:Protein EXORDIUM-like 4 n=1 Tax=Hibiscus syriacus TaxID=106335 RepID=A0A6A2WAC5_HIBSY|nr:Protein EXORDIUM-like 4 [Hibiscus syriacus]
MAASIYKLATIFLFCIIPSSFREQLREHPLVLNYHNGPLLKGKIAFNLIWYGKFTPSQRSIIVDFINSLSSANLKLPSASSWWKTTEKYRSGSSTLVVGKSSSKTTHSVYSETQCPGQCAWPFHQPIYGPQMPPLVAPNEDVGVDGMIINLATLLASTVTNPFNNGFFQGPTNAPLEAVSACTEMFGSGSYPGYPGNLLVEKTTGASYNANGVNGRKYLLSAMW